MDILAVGDIDAVIVPVSPVGKINVMDGQIAATVERESPAGAVEHVQPVDPDIPAMGQEHQLGT